jgi:aldose 1-epimerase
MKFAPPQSGRPDGSKARWSTSGWMTPGLVGLLCLGLLVGSYEHMHGNLHKLRTTVTPHQDGPVLSSGPCGQDPIYLTHRANEHGTDPEFTVATLLPGCGFNLWQLTAFLPGHGEVPLLISPPVAAAASLLTGSGDDANGSAARAFGGAFLAPWAGQLAGFPAPDNGMLQASWQGQRLGFPASGPGSTLSTEGLLLNRGADSVTTSNLTDGQSAQATFHAGTFSGGWPSDTDLTILVELSGHTLDLTVTAHNIGNNPEPFGIGWHPYFAIPSGDRAKAMLVLPSISRISPPNLQTGLSDGAILSTQGTSNDFLRASGTHLGNLSLNDTFVDLHASLLSDGPIAELRDPGSDYGLRVISLSSNITNLRVIAPDPKPWVSIGPNMNVPDPFGKEWDHLENTGMVTLQPGDSVQWKVRLEIFSLSRAAVASFDAP